MIEHFTALVLSYTLQTHQIDTVVWFESEKHCIKAMSSRAFDNVYNHIYELYGNEISMYCVVSEVQSTRIIKPKIRPLIKSN